MTTRLSVPHSWRDELSTVGLQNAPIASCSPVFPGCGGGGGLISATMGGGGGGGGGGGTSERDSSVVRSSSAVCSAISPSLGVPARSSTISCRSSERPVGW